MAVEKIIKVARVNSPGSSSGACTLVWLSGMQKQACQKSCIAQEEQ
jgi:hypothetical protein